MIDIREHGGNYGSGSGGALSKMNVFCQPNEPKDKEGIWIQSPNKESIKDVIIDNQIYSMNDWIKEDNKIPFLTDKIDYPIAIVEDKIFYIDKVTQIYDINTKVWSTKNLDIIVYPKTRCIAHKNKIFCFGGSGYRDEAQMVLFAIDINTYEITRLGSNAARPYFYDAQLFVENDKIYIAGGTGENRNPNKTIFVVDTNTYMLDELTTVPTYSTAWIPISISDASCLQYIALNNNIYAIGKGNSSAPSKVYCYNISTKSWFIAGEVAIEKRNFAFIAKDNKLFCIGGKNEYKPSSTIDVFDVISNTWSKYLDIPIPREYNLIYKQNDKFYLMNNFTIDVTNLEFDKWNINETLPLCNSRSRYVVNGTNLYMQVADMLYEYDLINNKGKFISNLPYSTGKVGLLSYGRDLYFIAGDGGSYTNYYIDHKDVFYKFNLDTNTWIKLPDYPRNLVTTVSTTGSIYNTKCFFHNNKIYAVGGLDYDGQRPALKDIFVFDIDKNLWEKKRSAPLSRIFTIAELYNNKIYIIGGYSGSANWEDADKGTQTMIYDIENDMWVYGQPMPIHLQDVGHVLIDDKIYCFGTNVILIYDITRNTWSQINNSLQTKKLIYSFFFKGTVYCITDTSEVYKYSFKSKQYTEGQVMLERTNNYIGKYFTQLLDPPKSLSKQNIRFPICFDNAWLFKNSTLQEYSTYYGDGEKWIKFKG